MRRILSLLIALAFLATAGVLLSAPVARAAQTSSTSGPLLWTPPTDVDSYPIDAITCPSATLCLAADRDGGVLWSTDPAGGAGKWHRATIDGTGEMTAISCPSTSLCVTTAAGGNFFYSTHPTGGRGAWTQEHNADPSVTSNNSDSAGAVTVRGLSCPSTKLCVAVDAAGNIAVSTNPTGGPSAWAVWHIDNDTTYGCVGSGLTCQPPIVGIACPSIAQCVAVDFSGNLLTTSAPAVQAPWTSTPTYGGSLSSLWSISCPTATFCATVDGIAGRVITFDPATPTAQTQRSLPYSPYGIWCQSQTLCLASAQTDGGISGLLGSADPAARNSTWSFGSPGGINAIACPTGSTVCFAADDEGNIAAGETTAGIGSALTSQLLSAHDLPTIAALDASPTLTLNFAGLIAGQVTLSFTVPATGSSALPVVIATPATHTFTTPGTAPLTLALTAAGRALFRSAKGPVSVTATATFATTTGSVSTTKQLTFYHPPKPPKPPKKR